MKKILCLLFCLVLLLPLTAAKAEMLPVEAEASTYPMVVEDDDSLVVEAAGTQYDNNNITAETNKEYTVNHHMPRSGYHNFHYWSTNGTNWTEIKWQNLIIDYRTSDFYATGKVNSNFTTFTFYSTGTFYYRVVTYDAVTDITYIDTYRFTVEQGITPSLRVSPSSANLEGGYATVLTLSGSYVSSFDFYSSDPKVASATYDNGTLYVEAWNTGTATIYFTGYGDYGNASASCKVTVSGTSEAKPIQYCSVNKIADQSYSGSPITPSLVVKDERVTLVEGTDYKLTYQNNTNPGTATITVTGIGAYTGKGLVDFIIRQPIDGATVTLSGASGLVYNGEAKKPTAKVTLSGKTLIEGTDYTVSYKNNTNAGTATVVITGIGNYIGSAEKNFLIHKAISDCTISAISDQYFIGEALCPDITIKDGSKVLVKGTDYSLTYSNNAKAGTASVIVTGLGIYTGKQTVTFEIQIPEPMSIGRTKISVDAGKKVLLKFVPKESGEYTFCTWTGDDTYGVLYDSKLNELASNDDGGINYNFCITRNLTANTVYYLSVFYFSNTDSGTFGVFALGWNLSDGVLTITGNGPMPLFDTFDTPWYSIRSSITSVVIGDGFTSISDYAFAECSSMTSVTIPNGVTYIGRDAFYLCKSLSNVTIPSSVTSIDDFVFTGCTSLTSLTIPNGITKINRICGGCTSLTTVIIPGSVTEVVYGAFYNTKVRDVWYQGTYAQWKAIRIDGDNTALTSASIHCLGDNILKLPASLQVIGSDALQGVSASVISVPSGVTKIQSRAFASCNELGYIIFNGSPSYIADDILGDCSDVTILAPRGSTAAAWANDHGFTVTYF